MTVSIDRTSAPILQIDDVHKTYRRRGGAIVHAVSGVSLSVGQGEALGIVGESGCGKSTLARLMVRLEQPDSGTIAVRGADLSNVRGRRLKEMRREVQIVFQDPYSSLNPRMTAAAIIGEALTLHPEVHIRDRQARILELLALVGLTGDQADRYPHQFSGGQRQRIGIARALALEPKLLVLDEPVSALDVSVQAQVINLLEDLRERLGLSYVLISHDLSVVGHTCHRVAVMYLGKIVEIGTTDEIFTRPTHPYTKALLSAMPTLERGKDHGTRIVLHGDIADPAHPPSGCHFRTRCWRATDLCAAENPVLTQRGPSIESACHHPLATADAT